MSDMKNDLSSFERGLLKVINFREGTKYTYKHFMEWSNSKERVENNLQSGEKIYEIDGIFVAMKECK